MKTKTALLAIILSVIFLLPTFALASSVDKSSPAIAFDPENNRYLVVYEGVETATTNYFIYGKFIDAHGWSMGPEFVISDAAGYNYAPSVAFDTEKRKYLVAWNNVVTTDSVNYIYCIRGRFLEADGSASAVLSGDFKITDDIDNTTDDTLVYFSTIAYGGGNFLVAWEDMLSANVGFQYIYGQIVKTDVLPDTNNNFQISSNPDQVEAWTPSLAFDSMNNRFVVVWDYFILADTSYAFQDMIYGRIIEAGKPANYYPEFLVTDDHSVKDFPSTAFDSANNRFIVAWRDELNIVDGEIFARIFKFDGSAFTGVFSVSNPPPFSGFDNYGQGNPSVAFDASNRRFLVTWHYNPFDWDYDIYGQWVYSDGSLSGYNFAVFSSGSDQLDSVVAFNSNYADFMVAFENLSLTPYDISILRFGGILLPRTGQSICYGISDALDIKSCIGSGQDGEKQYGIAWSEPRFENIVGGILSSGDKAVFDQLTGLIWMRDPITPAVWGCTGGPKTWEDALAYVACLNGSSGYLGYNDWRLPNIKELRSLGYYGAGDPYVNVFENPANRTFWSSTTNTLFNNEAWVSETWGNPTVQGQKLSKIKSGTYFVMPVRADSTGPAIVPVTGQKNGFDTNGTDGALEKGLAWPDPRFVDNGDFTITDNLTWLMWMQDADTPDYAVSPPPPNVASKVWGWLPNSQVLCTGGLKTWEGALNYVKCLNDNNYLSYNDWRLPNVNELESLVNDGFNEATCEGACISNAEWLYSGLFYNPYPNYYVTSTNSKDPDDVFVINMADGSIAEISKTSLFYVLPVRGGAKEPVLQTELKVEFTGIPPYITTGMEAGFQITVTNIGTAMAQSSFMSNTLPAGSSFVSVTASKGMCSNSGLVVNCGLGNIDKNASITVTINAKLNTIGKNTNTAAVSFANGAAKTASADTTVSPVQYTLTVNVTGSGTVKAPGLTCSGNICTGKYDSGTSVNLTAEAGAGYVLSSWSGCAVNGDGTCTAKIDGNKNVAATFVISAPATYNLTVSKSGNGTITGIPSGISCGDDCKETYNSGQMVTLTAKADEGWLFAGWSGCDNTNSSYCMVTMGIDKSVTANFEKNIPEVVAPKPGETLDFESVKIGRLRNKAYKITNNGKGYVTISASITGDDAKMFGVKLTGKKTLKPKGSYGLVVMFKPRSKGEKSATLNIKFNNPNIPDASITLKGTGKVK